MYWINIELWDGRRALFNLERVDAFVPGENRTAIYVKGHKQPFVTKMSINDIIDVIYKCMGKETKGDHN